MKIGTSDVNRPNKASAPFNVIPVRWGGPKEGHKCKNLIDVSKNLHFWLHRAGPVRLTSLLLTVLKEKSFNLYLLNSYLELQRLWQIVVEIVDRIPFLFLF